MQRLYLVPVETLWGMWVTTPEGHTWTLVPEGTEGAKRGRGPKYFAWNFHPTEGIRCAWAMMDYGYMPSALLLAKDISEADNVLLTDANHPDVYAFPLAVLPGGLGIPVASNDNLRNFLEGISVPTDWATASTTYLELLRCLAGIFQFAQRYSGVSGGQALLGNGVTLATRYRNLSAQQQAWFSATVASFGYSAAIINPNSTFRQMLKQAGDAWAQPFYLGGMEF